MIYTKLLNVSATPGHPDVNAHLLKFLHCVRSEVKIFHCFRCPPMKNPLFIFILAAPSVFLVLYSVAP
jgi:hypothetical protein